MSGFLKTHDKHNLMLVNDQRYFSYLVFTFFKASVFLIDYSTVSECDLYHYLLFFPDTHTLFAPLDQIHRECSGVKKKIEDFFFFFFLTEFPKPQLGDPKEMQALRIQPAQENPLLMSLSLANLLGKDTIKVELIPEKKGLFLKHVEYQVTSEVRGK